jgi:hypothetical protein
MKGEELNFDEFDIPELTEDDFARAVPNPYAEQSRKGMVYEVTALDGTKRVFVQFEVEKDLVERLASFRSMNEVLRLAMKNEEKKVAKQARTNGKKTVKKTVKTDTYI